MAIDPRKVLPTKINLIRLRREERMLRRIRGVMEEKREVLLHYIRAAAEDYNRYQKEVLGGVMGVLTSYYLGLSVEGVERVESYSATVPESLEVRVGTRVLFAVKTPVFRLDEETLPPIPAPPGGDSHLLSSMIDFRKLIPSILKLAEYEETIGRLIEELKDTQRLINAMDHVILPSYEEAIKYIKGVLEERMREDFTRMKMLKRKLEEKKAKPAAR